MAEITKFAQPAKLRNVNSTDFVVGHAVHDEAKEYEDCSGFLAWAADKPNVSLRFPRLVWEPAKNPCFIRG